MKKASFMILILFISIIVSTPSLADTSIIMVGHGVTKEEAIQDALRNAVESATGAYVYSTSETKNFILVKDKIVSACIGYVKNYNIITETSNDGMAFVKLNIVVNDDNIKEAIRRDVKIISYDDVLKDYSMVSQHIERNKKFAEILKSISSKPINDLYLVNYDGYEIIDSGITSVDVILKFRIALNVFIWNAYYDILKQINNNNGYGNKIVVNYERNNEINYFLDGKSVHINGDFDKYIIKPRYTQIKFNLNHDDYRLKPVILYDKIMSDKEYADQNSRFTNFSNINGYKNQMSELRTTQNEKLVSFIPNDGYEFNVKFTLKDADNIKSLLSVKVNLVEQ